jgi:hypothetical protein
LHTAGAAYANPGIGGYGAEDIEKKERTF